MGGLGRTAWTILGCVCLALGTAGAVIPVIPTVPLYMATAFCLAKGSKRLCDWFTGSSFHRKHLRPFLESRSMTLRGKIVVVSGLTVLMGIGFALMQGLVIPRIVLAAVWLFHIWYFTFRIKTAPGAPSRIDDAA